MPEGIHVVHSDAIYGVATWGRFVLVVWRREMTAPGVAMAGRAITQVTQSHPGQRVGVVVLIETDCAFAGSATAFEAGVDALKRYGSSLAATAMAYDREGFWTATLRGRVQSSFAESKTAVPYILRPTLTEACTWLKETAPDLPPVAVPALVRAVESLRSTR
jgi:hypothetical protein